MPGVDGRVGVAAGLVVIESERPAIEGDLRIALDEHAAPVPGDPAAAEVAEPGRKAN
ncbi:hypothetical protein [Burkholderia plantarii]|uniref:hypothetical protein n=1 Tax=Burkholderia plantarii TaxID=41899 RepID=UPI0018DCAC11|nr:hypothetical protein [Burkholderia plantarii]MBI0326850.1 hypothetical protein [Burkholderia plantarii]